MIGLETLLPVALQLLHEGELGLLELLGTLTVAPAHMLGAEAGRLRRGAPADLVLFDPEAPWKITEASLKSLVVGTVVVASADSARMLTGWRRCRRAMVTIADGMVAENSMVWRSSGVLARIRSTSGRKPRSSISSPRRGPAP